MSVESPILAQCKSTTTILSSLSLSNKISKWIVSGKWLNLKGSFRFYTITCIMQKVLSLMVSKGQRFSNGLKTSNIRVWSKLSTGSENKTCNRLGSSSVCLILCFIMNFWLKFIPKGIMDWIIFIMYALSTSLHSELKFMKYSSSLPAMWYNLQNWKLIKYHWFSSFSTFIAGNNAVDIYIDLNGKWCRNQCEVSKMPDMVTKIKTGSFLSKSHLVADI